MILIQSVHPAPGALPSFLPAPASAGRSPAREPQTGLSGHQTEEEETAGQSKCQIQLWTRPGPRERLWTRGTARPTGHRPQSTHPPTRPRGRKQARIKGALVVFEPCTRAPGPTSPVDDRLPDVSILLPALPRDNSQPACPAVRSSGEKTCFPRNRTGWKHPGSRPTGRAPFRRGRLEAREAGPAPSVGSRRTPPCRRPASGWPSPLLELPHSLHRPMAAFSPWVSLSLSSLYEDTGLTGLGAHLTPA